MRRLLLLAAAFPLAIVANIARVLFLILATAGLGDWVVESPLHAGTGVAAFCFVLVALFAVSDQRFALRPSA